MFQSEELKNHLETSSVIKTRSFVSAEWNMNVANNIKIIGNYRYRPTDDPGTKYYLPANTFDLNDAGNYYTGATDSDIVIDGGFKNDNTPIAFETDKQKEKMLFSLEDCFGRFRPRSGINKLRYFDGKYSHHTNIDMFSRPRYYMADKQDKFKYWTSYRTETDEGSNTERGIANTEINGQIYIDDAAPFVVYKNSIPTNRIIIKMQTNVGTENLGPFTNASGTFEDPLFGDANKTTPVRWKVQYLINDVWSDAISFDENSVRSTGLPIIGPDGYVELSYGLIIPEQYTNIFLYAGELSSATLLPEVAVIGQAYLVKSSDLAIGTYYVWNGTDYSTFEPTYGWNINEQSVVSQTPYVTNLTAPPAFTNPITGNTQYREFQYIDGLRIVVQTMNKIDSSFDLIELSPRLAVDLSEKVTSFSISKTASDLGISGLPVGQLLASTGTLELFDYDLAFASSNTSSIIKNQINQNVQVKLYEIIADVNNYDYYVPIKTMYVNGFPEINNLERTVSLELRDLYFYLESITAPQLLITEASLSYAIATLLDSIGFSNYVFKRLNSESDATIPYFFVPPDTSIAQVLNNLARSTQTAMFFDEYNNFVCMSKNYILPAEGERDIDITLSGSPDQTTDIAIKNKTTATPLSNILDISYQENQVFNDGRIDYTERYIQRSYGKIRQASLIDRDKTWIYKPVLLWEVAATESTKSINNEVSSQSAYVLGAIPLNSDLTNVVPQVQNGVLTNNTMDLGEGVYWLTRYNGYFYANGEIIKYDAVQYNIPGLSAAQGGPNVWISSVQEYQNYFSKVPFNGKIYPTGLVRIYAEPKYETIDGITRLQNGEVLRHGRGQFGTSVVNHFAGVNNYWTSPANVGGCTMMSEYLFTDTPAPATSVGQAGLVTENGKLSKSEAQKTTRNGIIRNFLSGSYPKESDTNRLFSTQTGTVQSSALILTGRTFPSTERPINFISYVHKELDNGYRHFGTRMRVIGKILNNSKTIQSPAGSSTYYTIIEDSPDENVNIGGASGGIAIMLNPETNNGYYFEIAALTTPKLSSTEQAELAEASQPTHNVMFYKIMQDPSKQINEPNAIPVKLYGGLSKILVDDGKFTGQYRITGEDNPTVYDLAVEYEDLGSTRRFYLYINNRIVATVDDENPLPVYNNVALFVRGSARCMFENIYAMSNNYALNTAFDINTPINEVFASKELNANDSFRKYAMSGIVQSTYLSGISSAEPPRYNLYFEEFGTIMREASYFNVRYDKAYPALYAQLSPTFNKIKGYTVSGFTAGAYGAEFMIFNATDTALNLDETSGNYLRIQGVTFTQQSTNELTVDSYFEKISNLSDPEISANGIIRSPLVAEQEYLDIKTSRLTYGKNEFSLEAPYIQTQDDANDMMEWMISKIMKPRLSLGVDIFANPAIQLGDIVNINYQDSNQINQVVPASKRFVVYNITYEKAADGPSMVLYLSEVV